MRSNVPAAAVQRRATHALRRCCSAGASNPRTSRRNLLLASIPAPLLLANRSKAAEPLPQAPVRPAFPPKEYLKRIEAARRPAMQELGELIDNYKFKEAAEALVLYPFDDVAQSTFYLPWAILQEDEQRAVPVQYSYVAFEDKLTAFRSICRQAASYNAEDEEVLEALYAMNAALNDFVETATKAIALS